MTNTHQKKILLYCSFELWRKNASSEITCILHIEKQRTLENHTEEITSGTQCQGLKRIGAFIGKKIDEIIEQYDKEKKKADLLTSLPDTNSQNSIEGPKSVKEWLDSLSLSQYLQRFNDAGFDHLISCQNLTQQDIDHIGIVTPGHIKRLQIASKLLGATSFPSTAPNFSNVIKHTTITNDIIPHTIALHTTTPHNITPHNITPHNITPHTTTTPYNTTPNIVPSHAITPSFITPSSITPTQNPLQIQQTQDETFITVKTSFLEIKRSSDSSPLPQISELFIKRNASPTTLSTVQRWFETNKDQYISTIQTDRNIKAYVKLPDEGDRIIQITTPKENNKVPIEKCTCDCGGNGRHYGLCSHLLVFLSCLQKEQSSLPQVSKLGSQDRGALFGNPTSYSKPDISSLPELLPRPNPQPSRQPNRKDYYPVARSGGWAILLALYLHPTHSLSKWNLIEKASLYSIYSFTVPSVDNYT